MSDDTVYFVVLHKNLPFNIQCYSSSCISYDLEIAIYKIQFSLHSIFCPQENTEEALLLLLISESMVSRMCFQILLHPPFLQSCFWYGHSISTVAILLGKRILSRGDTWVGGGKEQQGFKKRDVSFFFFF